MSAPTITASGNEGLILLGRDDPGFAAEAVSFSSLIEQRPQAVAAVRTGDEMAAAVRYAADRGMPVYVQGTGHGCAEIATGLLVSTRAMTGVRIDPEARTATVQAGTRWSAVIEAAAAHGLAPRSGSSPDVGVVGYTLGGGMPITARTFGFASDALISADTVLADGSQVTVDAEHDERLFWGLRGGKGPFSLVAGMTFRLETLSTVNGGALYFAGEHASDVLLTYRDWVRDLPESMSSSIALCRLPPAPMVPEPLRGVLSVAIRIVHVGDPAEAAALVAPLLTAAPLLLGGVGELPYSASASIYSDPPGPLPVISGGALLRQLTDDDIAALLDVCGPAHDIPFPIIELRHLGGALGRAPEAGLDAVSGRHGAFAAHAVGIVTPETAEITPRIESALQAAFAPAAAGGEQVNFAKETAYGVDVWGPEVFARLIAIKSAYDPANVFRGPLSFTPAIADEHAGSQHSS